MTVTEACERYLRELQARNLRKSTRGGYSSVFRMLQEFAARSSIEGLRELDKEVMRQWRDEWTAAAATRAKRLNLLKAFFSFAHEQGWITESPVKGLRRPKSTARPTMPLSEQEMRDLLGAAQHKPRELALLLLLRYSGLAIGDAVVLNRETLTPDGVLVLRRAKSGELVTVALPDKVLAALEAAAPAPKHYYFWTGRSEPVTAVKYWRERLKGVATAADVQGFHPHRLRDTFAVELLLAGVLMQDLSSLLGHSSVITTERYYAPWNLARRERLSRIALDVHQRDPVLLGFTPKKPAGTAQTIPAEASLATPCKPTLNAHG